LIYPYESSTSQMLYHKDLNLSYHLMMQKLYQMILPFLVVMLLMDHDHNALKPYISYFGRSYVTLYKLKLYSLIITWVYALFFMLYHILPSFLTTYYQLDNNAYVFILSIYLDAILLCLIVIYAIKEKYKALSLALPLIYMMFSFMQEDFNQVYLFYLFPMHSMYIYTIELAFLYKLCYILIGLLMTYRKQITEEI